MRRDRYDPLLLHPPPSALATRRPRSGGKNQPANARARVTGPKACAALYHPARPQDLATSLNAEDDVGNVVLSTRKDRIETGGLSIAVSERTEPSEREQLHREQVVARRQARVGSAGAVGAREKVGPKPPKFKTTSDAPAPEQLSGLRNGSSMLQATVAKRWSAQVGPPPPPPPPQPENGTASAANPRKSQVRVSAFILPSPVAIRCLTRDECRPPSYSSPSNRPRIEPPAGTLRPRSVAPDHPAQDRCRSLNAGKGVPVRPQRGDRDLVLRCDAIGPSSTLRYFERCGSGLALTRELALGTPRTRGGAVDVATDPTRTSRTLAISGAEQLQSVMARPS